MQDSDRLKIQALRAGDLKVPIVCSTADHEQLICRLCEQRERTGTLLNRLALCWAALKYEGSFFLFGGSFAISWSPLQLPLPLLNTFLFTSRKIVGH